MDRKFGGDRGKSRSTMTAMRIFAVIVAALTVAVLASVARAENPTKAYAERVLKASMTTKYKAAAPGLKITKVTCPEPKAIDVTTFTCVASFTYLKENAKGSYTVKEKISSNGKATWTAAIRNFTDTRTGKKITCG